MERPIAWMGVGLSPGNDLPWGKCLLNCAPGMGLMAGRGVVNHAPAGCFVRKVPKVGESLESKFSPAVLGQGVTGQFSP